MRGRNIRLFFVTLFFGILALMFGCTQPDDIAAPVSTTTVILQPMKFPTPPDNYFYKFWAVDSADNYYLIQKFFWNNYLQRVYDLDSNQIDTVFTVEYDLLDPFYEYLAISVEMLPDTMPDTIPGPIMLLDTIMDPDNGPMKMVFPLNYGGSFTGFSMQTPTDKDSYSQEASGVWFAYYTYDSMTIYDTTNVFMLTPPPIKEDRILTYDTTYWDCDSMGILTCARWTDVTNDVFLNPSYPYDTLIVDITPYPIDTVYWRCDSLDGATCVESTNVSDLFKWYDTLADPALYDWVVYDTLLDTLGLACVKQVVDYHYVPDTLNIDTFIHISVDYDFVTFPVNFNPNDTIDTSFTDPCTGAVTPLSILPLKDYIHVPLYFVDSVSKIDTVDNFSPIHNEETHDLTGTNWHYKGWILSPYLAPPFQPIDCPELGRLTPPAWLDFTVFDAFSDYFIEAYYSTPLEVPIISTGSFKSFGAGDYTPNIYSDNKRVPNFPGEDFIQNLPCGAESYYFADRLYPNVSTGKIFVTIEPDNYDTSTNFPFILFLSRYTIPSFSDISITEPNNSQNSIFFDLQNQSGAVTGNTAGFPWVQVTLIRE